MLHSRALSLARRADALIASTASTPLTGGTQRLTPIFAPGATEQLPAGNYWVAVEVSNAAAGLGGHVITAGPPAPGPLFHAIVPHAFGTPLTNVMIQSTAPFFNPNRAVFLNAYAVVLE